MPCVLKAPSGFPDARFDRLDDLDRIVVNPSEDMSVPSKYYLRNFFQECQMTGEMHAPWVRIYLPELDLVRSNRNARLVEYQEAGTGGSLID